MKDPIMNEYLEKMNNLRMHYMAFVSPDTYEALINAQVEKLKEMYDDVVKDQEKFNASLNEIAADMIKEHKKSK